MRRVAVDLTPSLFPILGVLVGLLGSLILIMATVAAFALGPSRTIRINVSGPSDTSRGESPTYIEFDGTALTLHPSRERVLFDPSKIQLSDSEIRRIVRSRGDLWKMYWRRFDEKLRDQLSGTGMVGLLTARANGSRTYVVILVRPSGFESFLPLRNFLMRQGLDVGYEPIEQNYKVSVG